MGIAKVNFSRIAALGSCLGVLLTSPVLAAEDPIVADGLSITANLAAVNNTNILYHEVVTGAFTTSASSSTVTVTHAASTALMSKPITVGAKVSFSETSAPVGGLTMDGGWTIATVPDSTHFTFTHSSPAGSTISTPTANTKITYSNYFDDGKLRFLCNFSHVGYDDPIVFPGQPSASHLHIFWSNTGTNANSTYNSLRVSGDGTCDGGALNRTAYWMPAMLDSAVNKVRVPVYFEWYYVMNRRDLVDFTSQTCSGTGLLQDGRPAACPQKAIKKIERGMRAVFGFRPSLPGYPATYAGQDLLAGVWTCHDTNGNIIAGAGSYRYLSNRSDPTKGVTGDAFCPSSGQISLRVNSPTCWDGNHDNADHYSHFATISQDGFSQPVCPATHPNTFMGFTGIAVWNYTGGIASVNSWYLSSDRHNGANFEAGETFHWDTEWAWNDTVQEFFHQQIHGMNPSSAIGAPYLLNSGGGDYAGGPYMRNTNDGGLGSDCTALGIAGPCTLAGHSAGISDKLLPIPSIRRRGAGLSR